VVIVFVNIHDVSSVDDVTVTFLTKYVAWLPRVGIWADCDNAGVVAGCQQTLKQNIGNFLALYVTRHLREIIT
jgi:hypothetical protein